MSKTTKVKKKSAPKLGAQEQEREQHRRALVRNNRREANIKQLSRRLLRAVQTSDQALVELARSITEARDYEHQIEETTEDA